MTLISKFSYSLVTILSISTSVLFSTTTANAATALTADDNFNVVVSKYADLAIRYKRVLPDPYYVPALDELSAERKSLATSSLNNALFVFPDKNGDPYFRISIIPKGYKLGERIDGVRGVKATKGPILRSYFTADSLKRISKVYVYNVPISKQAEMKARTTIRFSTTDGKIYSLSIYRGNPNPGVKIQFNSLAESKENMIRNELPDQNKVEFYK